MDVNFSEIIQEYEKVISKISPETSLGLPIDLLKHTPKMIQEAIKKTLALEYTKSQRDKRYIEELKKGYVYSARFISFSDYGLRRDIYDQGTALFFLKASVEERKTAFKFSADIQRREKELKSEIDRWCREFSV